VLLTNVLELTRDLAETLDEMPSDSNSGPHQFGQVRLAWLHAGRALGQIAAWPD
jgi:hypothetical protein